MNEFELADQRNRGTSLSAAGTLPCASRQERDHQPCPSEASWKVRVGTREADAQLACGRHLHRVCQAMYGAESPRRPALTVTAVWDAPISERDLKPGYHGEGELADYDPATGRSSWDDWGKD